MKKCAVIGSTGYIGSHLKYYLEREDIKLDLYDIKNIELPNYKSIDLTSKESIKSIDLDVEYIFLFFGFTGTYLGFDKYEKFNEVNELGLLNLLSYIRKSPYRPKIIFPSTRLVYKGIDRPLCEDDIKETKTIYAVNKLASEAYLQAYMNSFDIPYVVFRICVPYGNIISKNYSFGTVGFFIKQALKGNNITIYGDGNIKRTFTHIEDLCNQVINGAFSQHSNGQIYNISGETHTIKEVAELIAKKYGKDVISIPWPEKDKRIESGHTYFDDRKIQTLLNLPNSKKLIDFTKDL